jgi:predicted aconitase
LVKQFFIEVLVRFASSAEGPDVLVVLASQRDINGVSTHLFCDQVLCFIEVLIGVAENFKLTSSINTEGKIGICC